MNGDAFLIFASFDGDIAKTAAVTGETREALETLATVESWRPRLEQLRLIRSEQGPEAMLRELNRHANYRQALRVRDLLSAAIGEVSRVPLNQLLFVDTQTGRTFAAKGLSDLAKAVQTVQALTYQALGDLQGDRKREADAGGLGASLDALAMSAASSPGRRSVQAPPGSLSEALDSVAPSARALALAKAAPFQPSPRQQPKPKTLKSKLLDALETVDVEEDGSLE